MTATQDETIAELQRSVAALKARLDTALAERGNEYNERIAHQAATIEVLKLMSASPGDPRPVFDLVVERARELCGGYGSTMVRFDGKLIHHAAASASGISDDPAARAAVEARYPMLATRESAIGRAILERRTIRIDDLETEPGLDPGLPGLTVKSAASIPFIRDGVAIGAIVVGSRARGGFSDTQIELLETFAEQAVIAITSAETYRALQTRTGDLQESLEYQTATSAMLKVISRSTFDLQPVLDTVAETAARLCAADMATIARREGERFRFAAEFGYSPEYSAWRQSMGAYVPDRSTIGSRAILDRRTVHIHDVATEPGYRAESVTIGRQRTSLGVPLLRDGEAIGCIVLARQRVEPFTERQIELVTTFANQAVIAIENTRLLTEQQEALERQTATTEVLQAINASPGNLAPVFDAVLEKAMRLCGAAIGGIYSWDGTIFEQLALRGVTPALATFAAVQPMPRPPPGHVLSRLVIEKCPQQIPEFTDTDQYRNGETYGWALVHLGGIHAVLDVPLLKEGDVVGFIAIYREEPGTFPERQIALLEDFAAQAVIAMDNARLLTEQREALEQQTATAEVLQVINESPGDLTPVFDAMIEKAMRLCEAAFGTLLTYDGERFHNGAMRGVPTAYAEFRSRNPLKVWPGSPVARLLETKKFVHALDMKSDENYLIGDDSYRALADLGGARTVLFVPLLKDETVLGFISIYRQEVRAFSDKQIALLENFAAQAVIAMENARLIDEQREALEQQTATAEVLQVINASPGNLTPVFDAMLEKALRLCGAAFGQLATFDGNRFRAVVYRGVPGEVSRETLNEIVPEPGSALERVAKGDPVVHIPDMVDTDAYRDRIPSRVAMVERFGARTALWVALRKDDAVKGVIVIFRQEVRPFVAKQIALLENFAAQAVIAMENARLIDEQREALEQQIATAEVLQVINTSAGDLAPVFDTILEKAIQHCDSAFGNLNTYDGRLMHLVASRGMTPEQVALFPSRAPTPGTSTGQIAAGEDVVHVLDARAGDAYRAGLGATRSFVDQVGARTSLFVALRKDATLLGFFCLFRREVRAFTDKEIALLKSFAAQAVIAMESARLLNELRARTDELAQRQAELRVTFENMGDGVAMFDETQHLTAWNSRFQDILDVPDDIIARRQTFSEYARYLAERGEFGADTDVEEQVRRLLETSGRMRVFERVRPNGRVIEVRSNPVPGGGFVLIYADITERKRNEAEIAAARDAAQEATRTIEAAFRELKTAQANLIQAEKMASLGQLTAGIAHEIKNPLNFVNNFAILSVELLAELKDSIATALAMLTEDQRADVEETVGLLTSNLEKITEHGKRADGIVKAMLEHSRGESGERREVDINALADEALNLAYHGARAQDQSFNITLERDFAPGIAKIEVNPQDLTRVFLNLFSNGFYAANKRARNGAAAGFAPTLKVSTRDAGDQVEVRVRDNGTGIPADIRDKLFQPFFTTKPTGEGTGLGLSITYDIVTKAHGGTITVDSKVDDFTEFAVTLPRHMFAAEAASTRDH
jgi:GAF domain-containing protein/nitrogen-specific signal transduction histidine kinase